MEETVRALVKRGVSAQQIRISEATVADGRVRDRPEAGGVLVTGLAIGAAVGALFALLWMLPLEALAEVPLGLIVLGMLRSGASGAIIGALVAVIFYAVARARKVERGAPTGDFIVTVKTQDEALAEDVRGFLWFRGGELLPA
jgi:tetrahydromethanopterin S-methyltransferase subunit F